jgi:F-type H+-transporting ATPase subunit a
VVFGLEYPPIENLVEWPAFLFKGNELLAFNKISLINLIALVGTSVLFLLAGRQKGLVPRGVRNVVEIIVDFVEKQIMIPTAGIEARPYLPLMVSLFCFIFIGNIFEVIPLFHMPANARMAGPLVLALVVWVTFIAVGIKHQGGAFFGHIIWPPGVPTGLKPVVGLIEVLSTFIIRPFSHAVRLFANMLAGHILLVTFSVLCISLWAAQWYVVINIPTFAMLIILHGFEVGVAFLQAFVFTILTGVYIGGSIHPAHGSDHH